MKTSMILGAGLLILSAALLLRSPDNDPARVSNGAPPAIESEPPAKPVRTRRVKFHAEAPRAAGETIRADLRRAIETIEAETDADRRGEALEHAVAAVSNSELPGLLDSLATIEGPAAAEVRELLIRRWAETDGPAAAAWASQLEPGPTHDETLTQVALGWADTDLSAALDWAQTLPEGESREAVTLALGYEIARTDAVKALEVASRLNGMEAARQRDDLIEHAISQWATTDFAAAVQWADASVPDPDLRQRLLAAVAVAAAGQDGTAAATLAVTGLTPGHEQDRVAVAIVQRWVQNDPESAASWVAQFPGTLVGETAAQNLVAFWAAQDREAAANWLGTLPEGTLRNAGLTAYPVR